MWTGTYNLQMEALGVGWGERNGVERSDNVLSLQLSACEARNAEE